MKTALVDRHFTAHRCSDGELMRSTSKTKRWKSNNPPRGTDMAQGSSLALHDELASMPDQLQETCLRPKSKSSIGTQYNAESHRCHADVDLSDLASNMALPGHPSHRTMSHDRTTVLACFLTILTTIFGLKKGEKFHPFKKILIIGLACFFLTSSVQAQGVLLQVGEGDLSKCDTIADAFDQEKGPGDVRQLILGGHTWSHSVIAGMGKQVSGCTGKPVAFVKRFKSIDNFQHLVVQGEFAYPSSIFESATPANAMRYFGSVSMVLFGDQNPFDTSFKLEAYVYSLVLYNYNDDVQNGFSLVFKSSVDDTTLKVLQLTNGFYPVKSTSAFTWGSTIQSVDFWFAWDSMQTYPRGNPHNLNPKFAYERFNLGSNPINTTGFTVSPVQRKLTEYAKACKYCYTALAKFGGHALIIGGAKHKSDNIANEFYPVLRIQHATSPSANRTFEHISIEKLGDTSKAINYGIDSIASIYQDPNLDPAIVEQTLKFYAIAQPRSLNYDPLVLNEQQRLAFIVIDPSGGTFCKISVIMKEIYQPQNYGLFTDRQPFFMDIYPRSLQVQRMPDPVGGLENDPWQSRLIGKTYLSLPKRRIVGEKQHSISIFKTPFNYQCGQNNDADQLVTYFKDLADPAKTLAGQNLYTTGGDGLLSSLNEYGGTCWNTSDTCELVDIEQNYELNRENEGGHMYLLTTEKTYVYQQGQEYDQHFYQPLLGQNVMQGAILDTNFGSKSIIISRIQKDNQNEQFKLIQSLAPDIPLYFANYFYLLGPTLYTIDAVNLWDTSPGNIEEQISYVAEMTRTFTHSGSIFGMNPVYGLQMPWEYSTTGGGAKQDPYDNAIKVPFSRSLIAARANSGGQFNDVDVIWNSRLKFDGGLSTPYVGVLDEPNSQIIFRIDVNFEYLKLVSGFKIEVDDQFGNNWQEIAATKFCVNFDIGWYYNEIFACLGTTPTFKFHTLYKNTADQTAFWYNGAITDARKMMADYTISKVCHDGGNDNFVSAITNNPEMIDYDVFYLPFSKPFGFYITNINFVDAIENIVLQAIDQITEDNDLTYKFEWTDPAWEHLVSNSDADVNKTRQDQNIKMVINQKNCGKIINDQVSTGYTMLDTDQTEANSPLMPIKVPFRTTVTNCLDESITPINPNNHIFKIQKDSQDAALNGTQVVIAGADIHTLFTAPVNPTCAIVKYRITEITSQEDLHVTDSAIWGAKLSLPYPNNLDDIRVTTLLLSVQEKRKDLYIRSILRGDTVTTEISNELTGAPIQIRIGCFEETAITLGAKALGANPNVIAITTTYLEAVFTLQEGGIIKLNDVLTFTTDVAFCANPWSVTSYKDVGHTLLSDLQTDLTLQTVNPWYKDWTTGNFDGELMVRSNLLNLPAETGYLVFSTEGNHNQSPATADYEIRAKYCDDQPVVTDVSDYSPSLTLNMNPQIHQIDLTQAGVAMAVTHNATTAAICTGSEYLLSGAAYPGVPVAHPGVSLMGGSILLVDTSLAVGDGYDEFWVILRATKSMKETARRFKLPVVAPCSGVNLAPIVPTVFLEIQKNKPETNETYRTTLITGSNDPTVSTTNVLDLFPAATTHHATCHISEWYLSLNQTSTPLAPGGLLAKRFYEDTRVATAARLSVPVNLTSLEVNNEVIGKDIWFALQINVFVTTRFILNPQGAAFNLTLGCFEETLANFWTYKPDNGNPQMLTFQGGVATMLFAVAANESSPETYTLDLSTMFALEADYRDCGAASVAGYLDTAQLLPTNSTSQVTLETQPLLRSLNLQGNVIGTPVMVITWDTNTTQIAPFYVSAVGDTYTTALGYAQDHPTPVQTVGFQFRFCDESPYALGDRLSLENTKQAALDSNPVTFDLKPQLRYRTEYPGQCSGYKYYISANETLEGTTGVEELFESGSYNMSDIVYIDEEEILHLRPRVRLPYRFFVIMQSTATLKTAYRNFSIDVVDSLPYFAAPPPAQIDVVAYFDTEGNLKDEEQLFTYRGPRAGDARGNKIHIQFDGLKSQIHDGVPEASYITATQLPDDSFLITVDRSRIRGDESRTVAVLLTTDNQEPGTRPLVYYILVAAQRVQDVPVVVVEFKANNIWEELEQLQRQKQGEMPEYEYYDYYADEGDSTKSGSSGDGTTGLDDLFDGQLTASEVFERVKEGQRQIDLRQQKKQQLAQGFKLAKNVGFVFPGVEDDQIEQAKAAALEYRSSKSGNSRMPFKEVPAPSMTLKPIKNNDIVIEFNQKMLAPESINASLYQHLFAFSLVDDNDGTVSPAQFVDSDDQGAAAGRRLEQEAASDPEEGAAKLFNVTVEAHDQQKIQFKTHFYHANKVSRGENHDYIRIKILNPRLFRSAETLSQLTIDADGEQLVSSLPPLLDPATEKVLEYLADIIGYTIYGLILCSFLASVIVKNPNHSLYGMVREMQYIYLIFLIRVPVAAHTYVYFTAWSRFAQTDIFFGKQLLAGLAGHFTPTEPLNRHYMDMGYGSKNFVMNSGSYLLFAPAIVAQVKLYQLLNKCAVLGYKLRRCRLMGMYVYSPDYKRQITYGFQKLLLEFYFILSIAALLHVKAFSETDMWGGLDSLVSMAAVAHLVALALLPAAAVYALRKNRDRLYTKRNQEKYRVLLENLNVQKLRQALYNVFFMFRRFFSAVVIVYIQSWPYAQCTLLLIMSVMTLAYMFGSRPLKTITANRLQIVGETCIYISEGMMTTMTNINIPERLSDGLGWFMIFMSTFIILFNIILNIKEQVEDVIMAREEVRRRDQVYKHFAEVIKSRELLRVDMPLTDQPNMLHQNQSVERIAFCRKWNPERTWMINNGIDVSEYKDEHTYMDYLQKLSLVEEAKKQKFQKMLAYVAKRRTEQIYQEMLKSKIQARITHTKTKVKLSQFFQYSGIAFKEEEKKSQENKKTKKVQIKLSSLVNNINNKKKEIKTEKSKAKYATLAKLGQSGKSLNLSTIHQVEGEDEDEFKIEIDTLPQQPVAIEKLADVLKNDEEDFKVAPKVRVTTLESCLRNVENAQRFAGTNKEGQGKLLLKDQILDNVYQEMEHSHALTGFNPKDIENFDDVCFDDITALDDNFDKMRAGEQKTRVQGHMDIQRAFMGEKLSGKVMNMDPEELAKMRRELMDLNFLVDEDEESKNSEEYGEEALERFFGTVDKNKIQDVVSLKYLKNAGQNDYLQAVIQAIMEDDLLTKFLTQKEYKIEGKSQPFLDCLSKAWTSFYQEDLNFLEGKNDFVDMNYLVMFLRQTFNPNKSHDVVEFLKYFFAKLQAEAEFSLINFNSVFYQSFIPDVNEMIECRNHHKRASHSTDIIFTLQPKQSVLQFIKSHFGTNYERILCTKPGCKQKDLISKVYRELNTTPSMMFFNIPLADRFENKNKKYKRTKFPLKLDLNSYRSPSLLTEDVNAQYELIAIINFIGIKMEGSKYEVIAKRVSKDSPGMFAWVKYNSEGRSDVVIDEEKKDPEFKPQMFVYEKTRKVIVVEEEIEPTEPNLNEVQEEDEWQTK